MNPRIRVKLSVRLWRSKWAQRNMCRRSWTPLISWKCFISVLWVWEFFTSQSLPANEIRKSSNPAPPDVEQRVCAEESSTRGHHFFSRGLLHTDLWQKYSSSQVVTKSTKSQMKTNTLDYIHPYNDINDIYVRICITIFCLSLSGDLRWISICICIICMHRCAVVPYTFLSQDFSGYKVASGRTSMFK